VTAAKSARDKPASEKRIAANRRNAQRSTGPRTGGTRQSAAGAPRQTIDDLAQAQGLLEFHGRTIARRIT
jgi:hypothetical protein